MISIGTILQVSDNTGAKLVQCIKTPRKKASLVGEIIVVAIQQGRLKKEKDGGVRRALIVGTKKATKCRNDGSRLFFDKNSVILMKNDLPMGTRILGCVPHELRKKRFVKLVSLAPFLA